MNEQSFSTRQAFCIASFFLIGHVSIIYNGSPANADAWISVLIAFAATLPLALLAARLTNIFPGRNLFDLQLDLFGPVIGRITSSLFVLNTIHIGSIVLRDFISFMQITSILHTPLYVSAVLVILLSVYCLKAGINTLARYAAMALPVFLLITLADTVLSSSLFIDISRLPPPLYNGIGPVLKSSVTFASLQFFDLLLLPFVIHSLKNHRKAKAIYIGGAAVNAAVTTMVFIRSLLVLGANFTYTQYYASYVSMSLVEIGKFLQRIEVIIGAVLFMGVFIELTIYLYVAVLGLSKIMGFGDYRKYTAPVGMLLAAMALFAYPNSIADLPFAMDIYPYYGLLFRVILPVVIWVFAEIRLRKLKREGRLPEPPPSAEETPVARQDGGIPQNPDGVPEGRRQPT